MNPNKEQLYRDVEFLSAIRPYRNYKNIESLRKAAFYIEGEFEKIGLKVSRQQWEVQGNIYENIIAQFAPEQKRRFVIGAHYDAYKDQPAADDNASGVAGLLETARMLMIERPTLNYGIDFVSYCLEEPPFFRTKNMGSYIHAQSVFNRQIEVLGMVSLEMLGHFSHIGYDATRFVQPIKMKDFLVVAGVEKYESFNLHIANLLQGNRLLEIKTKTFSNNDKNGGPSDHRNYWEFGYPAVMLLGTSGERNPHYHKISDTIETIDFNLMSEVVNRVYKMTKSIYLNPEVYKPEFTQ